MHYTPLSLSLSGLSTNGSSPWGDDPRAAIDWVAALANELPALVAIQLDATMRGFRPRDLDRSARRDLASTIRRRGLACTGVDLLIPPEHFSRSDTQDRAFAAVCDALDLARSIAGAGVVSSVTTQFPSGDLPVALDAAREADRAGVLLSDTGWPLTSAHTHAPSLRVAIDAASVLVAGQDPAEQLLRLAASVASVRLTDANASNARMEVGAFGGRLDIPALLASIATLSSQVPLVLDLRGIPDPVGSIGRVLARLP
jgi:sugar phosphate isomerase/epimerase